MTATQPADDAALNEVFAFDRHTREAPAPQEQAQPAPAADKEAAISEAVEAINEQRTVPLAELVKERKKLQGERDEQQRLRMEAEARAKVMQEQMQSWQMPRAEAQRQPPPPDALTDPEGYLNHRLAELARKDHIRDLQYSERFARKEHGALVDEALAAARAAGLVNPRNQFFTNNYPDDPWGAMVAWHKKEKTLAAVGDDPAAYEKKLREKIEAELKGGAPAQPQTQPTSTQPQRFPGTIADKTATGPQGSHLTDEAALGSVFASNRKRK